ncbi:MAG: ferritin-like domain-containing protein [Saprospiraceae bacterium]
MEKTSTAKVSAKKDAAKGLDDLFLDSLKDIYWAEKALTKSLPKMMSNSTNTKLKKGLESHLSETKEHVTRLENVFELLGEKAQAKKCDAMVGILEEGNGILEETQVGAVRDAGIISACQKVEHYEIAAYGTLVAFANQLGHKSVSKILSSTLKEEYAANDHLTGLAVPEINVSADN